MESQGNFQRRRVVVLSRIYVPSGFNFYHPRSIRVPFALSVFCSRTIRVPSAFYPRTVRVPSSTRLRSIRVPSAFYPASVFHLRPVLVSSGCIFGICVPFAFYPRSERNFDCAHFFPTTGPVRFHLTTLERNRQSKFSNNRDKLGQCP